MKIHLKRMEFYAYHGYYASEKQIGGRFLVSVKIKTMNDKACITDKLSDALNYQAIYDLVRQEMNITSDLLEHVCVRIAEGLRASFPDIAKVTVKLSKMNPPLGGQIEKVTISVIR